MSAMSPLSWAAFNPTIRQPTMARRNLFLPVRQFVEDSSPPKPHQDLCIDPGLHQQSEGLVRRTRTSLTFTPTPFVSASARVRIDAHTEFISRLQGLHNVGHGGLHTSSQSQLHSHAPTPTSSHTHEQRLGRFRVLRSAAAGLTVRILATTRTRTPSPTHTSPHRHLKTLRSPDPRRCNMR